MELDLAIRGGTVVTASDTIRCDVGIRGERIVALGENLRAQREIDAAGEQCLLDLFGEQAYAADLRQRSVLDAVAGGADDLQFDSLGRHSMRRGEAVAHLMRLRQRERTAARANSQQRRRRLRHGTPQC